MGHEQPHLQLVFKVDREKFSFLVDFMADHGLLNPVEDLMGDHGHLNLVLDLKDHEAEDLMVQFCYQSYLMILQLEEELWVLSIQKQSLNPFL